MPFRLALRRLSRVRGDLAACEAFVAQASASGVPVRYAPVISCAAKVQGLKEAEWLAVVQCG